MISLFSLTVGQVVVSSGTQSPATFTLPQSAMRVVRTRLCGNKFYIKTLDWHVRAGDSRPRFNSITALSSNLTTLELYTRCNATLQKVLHRSMVMSAPGGSPVVTYIPGLLRLLSCAVHAIRSHYKA